jgi:uncharacterized protein involved in response to NO
MSATSEQRRAWDGPAVFSFGFRPFFLGGAVWAALAMLMWIGLLTGRITVPTAFDPISWHAHEFLFGYLGAVIAGFMMTAVPNWTGRMPIVGWPLVGLFAVWIIGRLAVGCSQMIPSVVVALADLGFLILLAGAMAREVIAGKNWRNLIVVSLLGVFILANGIFHWEAARGGVAAHGYGLRLGVGTAIVLIAVIGGRIVPSFTRNWLAKQGAKRLPVPPMQPLDRIAILGLVAALLLWIIWPFAWTTSVALLVAGTLHLIRLSRWCGLHTGREPLVLVLHVAYLFIPLGALTQGVAGLWPNMMIGAPALHIWMAGAAGLMTLAVMTRATLGHTGQPLTANTATLALYLCLLAAVVLRVAAGFLPIWSASLHAISGLCWIAAFGGFGLVYGPLLLRRTASAG